MIRSYLERGLKAGAIGGLVFGLFVAVVGNPLVGYVEGLGKHADHGGEAAQHSEAAVSPLVTNLVSVGGGVLWGLFLGAVAFGIVYYFLEPAIPGTGATKQYTLAAAGFVTVSGSPWLVLPPQPAGVEAVLPTDTRLLLYGGMVAAGAAVCILSGYAYRRLTARSVQRRLAAVCALAPFALLVVPVTLAPATAGAGEVAASMAATYQGFVIVGQAGLWFVIATAHAWLSVKNASTTETDVAVDDQAYTAD